MKVDRSLDPDPDVVLSRPGRVTDEILRSVKFCPSVSILTGAASLAITVKEEQLTETQRPLYAANLLTGRLSANQILTFGHAETQ